jgi:hypothetical protein
VKTLADPATAAALRSARSSINDAIRAARLGDGIRYDCYLAQATLRQLITDLESTK